jgi:D-alanyl-D-alanine carboxypeptidase
MKEIDQILYKEVETNRSPAVQYYLFSSDQIIHAFHYGFADIEKKIPADAGTNYHAFSVTKTFTALAILQLAAQNRITIERPIIHYLPGFLYGEEITIRQILTHSAGIPNPIPLNWIHLPTEHSSFDRKSFFQTVMEKNRKPKFRPNEKYAYSNLGYIILGELIEKISGKPYEEYITEHIINQLPLAGNNLGFTLKDEAKHPTGYHKAMSFSNLILGLFLDKKKFMGKAHKGWKPFHPFYVNGASYGGLIGQPIAFVKYIQEFLKQDSELVPVGYKQLLFHENLTNRNQKTGMCLSWFKGELNGQAYFTHAGGGGGYYCEIRVYPGINLGSVIFFNRTGMRDERFLNNTDAVYLSSQNFRSGS